MPRRQAALFLALIGVVLVLAIVVGSSEPDDRTDPRASTYLTSDGGLQALYWTLEALDVPLRRRQEPLGEGAPLQGPIALIAPTEHPSAAEAGALAGHVRAGATLLVAPASFEFGGLLYDTLGLATEWIPGGGLTAMAEGDTATARPHRWTAGTRTVATFRKVWTDTARALRTPGVDTLLVVNGRPAAIAFSLGRGRVIAFADHQALTNERLRTSGAAAVFARMAAEATAGGQALTFDEYHHGFQGDGSLVSGTLSWAVRQRWGYAALQLLAAALLVLVVSAHRFGAPLPPAPLRRRSPLEHVEALAGAYRQAGARHTVRRLLVAGLARRLGRRAPTDEAAAGELVSRLARQSPTGHAAAAALQAEWTRGSDTELVALARDIDTLLEEVRRT